MRECKFYQCLHLQKVPISTSTISISGNTIRIIPTTPILLLDNLLSLADDFEFTYADVCFLFISRSLTAISINSSFVIFAYNNRPMVVHEHEHCVFDGVYVVCAILVSLTVADVVLDSSAGNEVDK